MSRGALRAGSGRRGPRAGAPARRGWRAALRPWVLLASTLVLGGCPSRTPEPDPGGRIIAASAASTPSEAARPARVLAAEDGASADFRRPAAPRLVAIGDLHGDVAATRDVLRLAGAIDAHDEWSGRSLVVVQTGDQLDRGDQEREVLELLDRVATAARGAGGALYRLVGNHELMNVQGDFRYVTPAGFTAFGAGDEAASSSVPSALLARFPAEQRARAAALLPGGPVARRLAEQPVVLVVGDTVFVHGGLREAHLRHGVSRLNRESRAFMTGAGEAPPELTGPESPVWTRRFSTDPVPAEACDEVERVTRALGVARMVVGHSVQRGGVSAACGGRVWRVDVGLSAYYGSHRGALEITAAGARPLPAAP
jgi:hypothetical protein